MSPRDCLRGSSVKPLSRKILRASGTFCAGSPACARKYRARLAEDDGVVAFFAETGGLRIGPTSRAKTRYLCRANPNRALHFFALHDPCYAGSPHRGRRLPSARALRWGVRVETSTPVAAGAPAATLHGADEVSMRACRGGGDKFCARQARIFATWLRAGISRPPTVRCCFAKLGSRNFDKELG